MSTAPKGPLEFRDTVDPDSITTLLDTVCVPEIRTVYDMLVSAVIVRTAPSLVVSVTTRVACWYTPELAYGAS
jgi:hypothetical protein